MEQVTAFRASDGALFENSEDCKDYETSLELRPMMDAFTGSALNPYPTGAHLNMCRKVIVAWERFKVDSFFDSKKECGP